MSEVNICNRALTLLGAEVITSLGDDTQEAKLCAIHYPGVRDAVLHERDWTFATEWQTLTQIADPPLSEYPNAFQLPTDTLAVLFVGQDYTRPAPKWQVEGDAVRTDETTCKAQLLTRVKDTSRYPPLFEEALVSRLAAELATPITESRQLMLDLMQSYAEKVRMAAARDSQQGRSRRLRSRWLSNARYRDGTPWAGPYV